MYGKVNMLFGDIVKVTPSSKVVGDMTLFMINNGIDEKNIYEKGQKLSFPKSVVDFFDGKLGTPYFRRNFKTSYLEERNLTLKKSRKT